MNDRNKEEKDIEIKKEIARLSRIYSRIGTKRKAAIQGLIQRAAFMRITLAELEEDLNTDGFTELFSQGDKQEPYERKRPSADIYNSMNTSYQKVIKQLTDLLPPEKPSPPNGKSGDNFDDFVGGREDV